MWENQRWSTGSMCAKANNVGNCNSTPHEKLSQWMTPGKWIWTTDFQNLTGQGLEQLDLNSKLAVPWAEGWSRSFPTLLILSICWAILYLTSLNDLMRSNVWKHSFVTTVGSYRRVWPSWRPCELIIALLLIPLWFFPVISWHNADFSNFICEILLSWAECKLGSIAQMLFLYFFCISEK